MRTIRKHSALALVGLMLLSPLAAFAQKRQRAATPTRQGIRQASNGIPGNPRDLKFPTLNFTPPKREQYRHVLSNGAVVYLVEDHDLPLINLQGLVRTGSYLEPAGKEGLASLTGSQMRAGGTESKTAEQFDEAADFLAASISSFIGATQGSASLNCLTKDIDQGLALYVDMLKHPRFQEDRLKLAKSQILQGMERRNDRTDAIEGREWGRLLHGAGHFSSKEPTKTSIESITRDDMLAFHNKYYQPAGFIFAVSGDFKTDEMIAKLESAMQGWASIKMAVPPPPAPEFTPTPGIYVVNKADVNQTRVSIGQIGAMRDNPDSYAISIMNEILGGGGFTSRITSRVRSDEGLAYSAGSSFGLGTYYPGDFRAAFQSKNGSASQAIQIVLEEIGKIRTTKVTPEELEIAKNYSIEVFPRFFATAAQIAGTFAQDEFTKRPADYWDTYRAKVKTVTADDVQRVAQKYLQPDRLVILVVGNVDEVVKGNPDKPQYSLVKIAHNGEFKRIPLPDPLTLQYPDGQ
jgi:predicted Zn-dependent peptidase